MSEIGEIVDALRPFAEHPEFNAHSGPVDDYGRARAALPLAQRLEEVMPKVVEALRWITECAERRNTDPRARTVNLKFSRLTLDTWLERSREALQAIQQLRGQVK